MTLPSGPSDRIYLDNAATSFPKPPSVVRAMGEYATELGASPGRGSYDEACQGAALLDRCRRLLCELIGAPGAPEQLVFTLNCSDALNLAIHGTVDWWRRTQPGEPIRVVTSAMDHNSVLRPFEALRARGVEVVRVPADVRGMVDPGEVVRAIDAQTRLVSLVHASNVTGSVQDLAPVGRACRETGVPFLVDAAQSLGHIPVDVESLGIDLLAFPGHKGLLGPLGTGGLWIRPGVEARIDPIRQGGTGSKSESDRQPDDLPDRYESGSHNTIGIAGLLAGVAWVLDRGVESLREHESALIRAFLDGFPGEAGFTLLGPTDPTARVGVFAMTHDRLSPHQIAQGLEREAGVLGRAGLHCAPGAHDALGSSAGGGACRLSVGAFTTREDIDRACAALRVIGGTAGQEVRGSSIQPASV